jgi:hypothetical protein
MSTTAKLSAADLAQFTGSEHWYRHGLNRQILFTDGARYVADGGGAYWLLDEIAFVQRFESVWRDSLFRSGNSPSTPIIPARSPWKTATIM